jgi:hypothetical protein
LTIFGGQTITILSRSQTSVDALGAAVFTPTNTAIPGCRHRPVTPVTSGSGGEARSEKTTEVGVGVSSSWWKSTIPINSATSAAVLSIQPNDAIMVGGVTYEVVSGSHVFTDLAGHPFKATVVSVLQEVSI